MQKTRDERVYEFSQILSAFNSIQDESNIFSTSTRKPKYWSWEEPTVKGRDKWHRDAQKHRKRKKRKRLKKRGY